MAHPALEAAPEDREVVRLRREIAGLEQELEEARNGAITAKQAAKDSVQAIAAMRKQLEPLYTSLRMLFGEISRVEVDSIGDLGPSLNANSGVWADRMAKSNGAQKRILQVLLDGGGAMELRQIRAAAGTGGGTSGVLNQLQAKNWVQKLGGGEWALK